MQSRCGKLFLVLGLLGLLGGCVGGTRGTGTEVKMAPFYAEPKELDLNPDKKEDEDCSVFGGKRC